MSRAPRAARAPGAPALCETREDRRPARANAGGLAVTHACWAEQRRRTAGGGFHEVENDVLNYDV